MRGGWCGGSRTSCASGRGSRENAERGSRNAERPDTLLAAARPFPDVPRSTFRVPRSPGPPICRPRRSARPLRPLAHPPHAPFPRSFPPGIPGRRRGGRPGGRACVPAARVGASPASPGGRPDAGGRHRRGQRRHARLPVRPHLSLPPASGHGARVAALRQLAPARHDARAHTRFSPRPGAGCLGRRAGGLRPTPRSVSERLSAQLGDGRPGGLLRVEVHQRRAGDGKPAHAAARGRSRCGRVAFALERGVLHPLGGWARAVRVRQPLLPLPRGPNRGFRRAAVRGGDVRPADPVSGGAADRSRCARSLAAGGMAHGDTLVVAQLDWTSRWQVHSDLYRWLPGGQWHRETRGARLVSPRAGGGRLSVIAMLPAGNRPALPVPPGPAGGSATWGEVVPSPDGRHVAGTRNANGHWALLRWPADSPEAGTVLRESAGVITDPTWTPAGELLFVTDLTGFPQVYRWRDS